MDAKTLVIIIAGVVGLFTEHQNAGSSLSLESQRATAYHSSLHNRVAALEDSLRILKKRTRVLERRLAKRPVPGTAPSTASGGLIERPVGESLVERPLLARVFLSVLHPFHHHDTEVDR